MCLPKHPAAGRQTGGLPALEVYLRSITQPCVATRPRSTPTQFSSSGPLLQNTCAHTTRRETTMGTKFFPLFRCITSKRLVVFAVALLAIAFVATPTFAQAPPPQHNCIQNEWNLEQGNSLNCTSGSCSLNCTANGVLL